MSNQRSTFRDKYIVIVTENSFSRNDLIQDHEAHVNREYMENPHVTNVKLGSLHIFSCNDLWRAEQAVTFTERLSDPVPDQTVDEEEKSLPTHTYFGLGNAWVEALGELGKNVYTFCLDPVTGIFKRESVKLGKIVLTCQDGVDDKYWKAEQTVTGELIHPPDPPGPSPKEKTIKPQKSNHGLLLPITITGVEMDRERAIEDLRREIGYYVTANQLESVELGPLRVFETKPPEFFSWRAEQEITNVKKRSSLYHSQLAQSQELPEKKEESRQFVEYGKSPDNAVNGLKRQVDDSLSIFDHSLLTVGPILLTETPRPDPGTMEVWLPWAAKQTVTGQFKLKKGQDTHNG
jgi:hypothetical protein